MDANVLESIQHKMSLEAHNEQNNVMGVMEQET